MNKFNKILSYLSGILAIIVSVIFIQQKLLTDQSGDSWQDLGFFLSMLIFLAIAIILTIIYLVIGFKLKFKNMRPYTISHLSFLGLSIIFFIISLL
ncbi:MAG: hypothetical protein WCZ00_04390 [Acholeplasmataceae bacterium]